MGASITNSAKSTATATTTTLMRQRTSVTAAATMTSSQFRYSSRGGGADSDAPHQGGGAAGTGLKPHLQETPTKDRIPPATYDPRNPKRRLAVLIDASKISADTFITTIEPALHGCGVPVIVRVFDTDLRPDWVPVVEGSMSAAAVREGIASLDGSGGGASSTRSATYASTPDVPPPTIEWFRVDRFIPVSMQMSADANHIYEYRTQNKVEGVAYVCTSVERQRFEVYFDRLVGRSFAQFAFDEEGLGGKLIEDRRSLDGSTSA